MVAVQITRQAVEVGALAPATAGFTRVDAEVATPAQSATSGRVQITRVAIEILGRGPLRAAVTRLDTEVATSSQAATSGRVAVSRVAVEILGRGPVRADITRLDAEVATTSQAATSGRVAITRQSVEVSAHRGAAGLVDPLAVPAGWEVFLHNWVDEAVLRSSYMTDIATSPTTGAESRRGLVLKPERTISLLWQIHGCNGADLARLDRLLVMLRKLTNERGPIPLYMDQRELNAPYTALDTVVLVDTTRGRFFNGARMVIVQLDWRGSYASHSFHIASSVQDTQITFTAPLGVAVPAGSLILPMMDCEVTLEAASELVTARNMAVKIDLTEVAGASQLPPVKSDNPLNAQTFDGIPIFDIDPDWIRGITKGRNRQGQKYTQGRTGRVYRAAERSREYHKLDLTGLRNCDTPARDDIWRVVEMFDTRRGRLRSLWHIDQEQVWTPSSVDPAGAFVSVEQIGDFADFEAELEGFWVGIVMRDGTFYVREAVDVQQVLTVFRITVDPILPINIDVNDIVRIARARRTRFLSDELTESWKHAGYMSTTVELLETLNERYTEIT